MAGGYPGLCLPSSPASGPCGRAVNTPSCASAPAGGHWARGIRKEGRRNQRSQAWGGTSWIPSFSQHPETTQGPREVMEISLSPRPLEGGSDKSFKSSFYGGRNCCWKWAPHARKPQQLRGKQPIHHWQSPLHTAASPGPDWLAWVHPCHCASAPETPRVSHLAHAVALPETLRRGTRG